MPSDPKPIRRPLGDERGLSPAEPERPPRVPITALWRRLAAADLLVERIVMEDAQMRLGSWIMSAAHEYERLRAVEKSDEPTFTGMPLSDIVRDLLSLEDIARRQDVRAEQLYDENQLLRGDMRRLRMSFAFLRSLADRVSAGGGMQTVDDLLNGVRLAPEADEWDCSRCDPTHRTFREHFTAIGFTPPSSPTGRQS